MAPGDLAMPRGILAQIRLSYRMTAGALAMTFRYPASLGVAFANLLFLLATAAGPIAGMVYLALEDSDKAWWALNHVFQFWPVAAQYAALEAGTATPGDVAGAFTIWLLCTYVAWVTAVTFGSLVTTTVIMHTGVQQIRGETPRLVDGFRLVGRNFWRLLGLALLTGAVMGFVRRALSTLRTIPLVGRFIVQAMVSVLTATLYVTLPVVVYERQGVWASFRSTLRQIRETWGGLAIGTGLMLTSLWFALWVVDYAILAGLEKVTGFQLVDWTTILVMQILAGVLLYAFNVALAANLRAALYMHVNEGAQSFIPDEAFVRTPAPRAPPVAELTVVPRGPSS